MSGRSHYDVLGVSPDAKADAIRRAYLRQARRWHPDRPAGDAEQMRAVNEAWEVLGDIRSRAAYDRGLARQRASTAGQSPPQSAGRPGHTGAPRSAGSARPTGNPRAESSPPPAATPPLEMVGVRWRWISLVVAALVAGAVVLIVVATSAIDDSDPDRPITPSAPVSQSRPEPGDCFVIGTTTLTAVPCDHPHDGKLVEWVPLGAPCPPDTELHWVRSAQEAVCYHPLAG